MNGPIVGKSCVRKKTEKQTNKQTQILDDEFNVLSQLKTRAPIFFCAASLLP